MRLLLTDEKLAKVPLTVLSFVKNLAVQKLTRVEFKVPVASLKRGPNTLVIAVNRTGSFPASRPVKVEKVELHLK